MCVIASASEAIPGRTEELDSFVAQAPRNHEDGHTGCQNY
jgi:hypothetical protein